MNELKIYYSEVHLAREKVRVAEKELGEVIKKEFPLDSEGHRTHPKGKV